MLEEGSPFLRLVEQVTKPWLKVCLEKVGKKTSLDFEVLHHACDVGEVRLQFDLLVTQVVQLRAEPGDVGLEHDLDIGLGRGLLLQEFPFGLQHFVLLFQEAHLEKRNRALDLDRLNFEIYGIY